MTPEARAAIRQEWQAVIDDYGDATVGLSVQIAHSLRTILDWARETVALCDALDEAESDLQRVTAERDALRAQLSGCHISTVRTPNMDNPPAPTADPKE